MHSSLGRHKGRLVMVLAFAPKGASPLQNYFLFYSCYGRTWYRLLYGKLVLKVPRWSYRNPYIRTILADVISSTNHEQTDSNHERDDQNESAASFLIPFDRTIYSLVTSLLHVIYDSPESSISRDASASEGNEWLQFSDVQRPQGQGWISKESKPSRVRSIFDFSSLPRPYNLSSNLKISH